MAYRMRPATYEEARTHVKSGKSAIPFLPVAKRDMQFLIGEPRDCRFGLGYSPNANSGSLTARDQIAFGACVAQDFRFGTNVT